MYIERLSVDVIVDRAREEFSEPIGANIGSTENLLVGVGPGALIVIPLRGNEDRRVRGVARNAPKRAESGQEPYNEPNPFREETRETY